MQASIDFGFEEPAKSPIKTTKPISTLLPGEKSYDIKIQRVKDAKAKSATVTSLYGNEGSTFYASGCSGFSDLLGFIKDNRNVCVNSVDLGARAEALLIEYLNTTENLCFFDSGAFRLLGESGKSLDFDNVFNRYISIAEQLNNRSQLMFCAPDIIGKQAQSIDLQLTYANELKHLIGMGVKIMFPIQKGALTLSAVYSQLRNLFGKSNIIVGLPANACAIPHNEIVRFLIEHEPCGAHLLGANKEKPIVIRAINASPNTVISSDSNRIAAYVGKDKPLTDLRQDLEDEAVGFYNDIAKNSRGEIRTPTPTALLETRTRSFDMNKDYTEFDEAEFVLSLEETDLTRLGEALHWLNIEHRTNEALIDAANSGSIYQWLEDEYNDDFASVVLPEFWDFYRLMISERMNNKKYIRKHIGPKCRTEAIYHLSRCGVFD